MIVTNRKNGFGSLGLIAFVTVVGIMCAAIQLSSVRSMQGSQNTVERLQLQAAAEGAAVLVLSGDLPTTGTLDIGKCRVTVSPESDTTSTLTPAAARLEVSLLKNGKARNSRQWRLALPPAQASLELLP